MFPVALAGTSITRENSTFPEGHSETTSMATGSSCPSPKANHTVAPLTPTLSPTVTVNSKGSPVVAVRPVPSLMITGPLMSTTSTVRTPVVFTLPARSEQPRT